MFGTGYRIDGHENTDVIKNISDIDIYYQVYSGSKLQPYTSFKMLKAGEEDRLVRNSFPHPILLSHSPRIYYTPANVVGYQDLHQVPDARILYLRGDSSDKIE
ncbi:unnamed protein product [Bursaphelenchus xylophilus]|uniref:(pine wood nematode) hypothetical protein n=1 Tax=Bursaphelenchus xylophilus TaxID=6326 RepID=A0A1I7S177_BURXY|nr:unnamed protein product [Bursaphelenchus xylophilus]CAG9080081.1 unnamed protein product [Bursaphelenchus xylophilus]